MGESFGGGIVFYVYDNGKHGLIIAAEDQSTGINASTFTSSNCCTTTNAFRDGVNAGISNTERIIISQGSGSYAASLAANYKGGGYGDWYLPSIEELNKMYQNIGQGNALGLGNVGGFAVTSYWSSTDSDGLSAGTQNFNNGNQDFYFKDGYFNVRSVRAF